MLERPSGQEKAPRGEESASGGHKTDIASSELSAGNQMMFLPRVKLAACAAWPAWLARVWLSTRLRGGK